MSADEVYDVIVIGGGPMGLSTAYECAKAGQKVLVLEKSVFFNQAGSSGDLVRMFRTAYTEDFMATLAYQSMALWDDLETEAGTSLRLMTGLLNFGDPTYGAGGPEGTLKGPIPNLKKYGLKYTELTRDDIEAQNPFQNLPDDWVGLDMPDNGVINVTLLTRTLFRLCEQLGVKLLQYAYVNSVTPCISDPSLWLVGGLLGSDKGASAAPNQFTFGAHKIAITCGAYVNHILYPSFCFSLNLQIWEMVFEYYSIDPTISFPKMWFQFAQDTSATTPASNLFYGFPSVPWGPPNLARIAVDSATRTISDPSERSHSDIPSADLEHTRQWVRSHVRGCSADPVPVFAGVGLQTNVYDNMFVLDYIPGDLMPAAGPQREKSIAVFTAGWGMKFVPLIGKVLKELLVDGGTTAYDISQFKMDRGEGKIIRDDAVQGTDNLVARANFSSQRC
ncbi:FAD/NAD(P)-binding domain-containing protein [Obba rivulosa]|uniref:FAD/NAD(P)-binding domain-containing protein n=1 Tax=Obba rivulosa TaxID=1052685 RepID=A0A8E2DLM8_9APHY|nr:FAD/NAD(P)-binding domain-containing protein [Obba rivulosa]